MLSKELLKELENKNIKLGKEFIESHNTFKYFVEFKNKGKIYLSEITNKNGVSFIKTIEDMNKLNLLLDFVNKIDKENFNAIVYKTEMHLITKELGRGNPYIEDLFKDDFELTKKDFNKEELELLERDGSIIEER